MYIQTCIQQGTEAVYIQTCVQQGTGAVYIQTCVQQGTEAVHVFTVSVPPTHRFTCRHSFSSLLSTCLHVHSLMLESAFESPKWVQKCAAIPIIT